MGQAISAIRIELNAPGEEKKQVLEQRLQILEKMVEGRLQHQLKEMLSGERNDQEIHIGTIVELQNKLTFP